MVGDILAASAVILIGAYSLVQLLRLARTIIATSAKQEGVIYPDSMIAALASPNDEGKAE